MRRSPERPRPCTRLLWALAGILSFTYNRSVDIDRSYSRVASCSADTAAVLRRARDLVEVVQPSDHLAFAVLQIQLTGTRR